MRSRRLTLALLLYVSLDLSSPFVPGAFNFDPDDSVEGVSRVRERSEHQPVATPTPAPRPRLEGVPGAPPVAPGRPVGPRRTVDEWLVDVRRAHAPVPEASTLSEDH